YNLQQYPSRTTSAVTRPPPDPGSADRSGRRPPAGPRPASAISAGTDLPARTATQYRAPWPRHAAPSLGTAADAPSAKSRRRGPLPPVAPQTPGRPPPAGPDALPVRSGTRTSPRNTPAPPERMPDKRGRGPRTPVPRP